MTSGSRTIGSLVNIPTGCGSGSLAGRRYVKTWYGDDRPVDVTKSWKLIKHGPVYRLVWKYDKRWRGYYAKELVKPGTIEWRIRNKYSRKPLSGNEASDQHAYSVTFDKVRYPVFTWRAVAQKGYPPNPWRDGTLISCFGAWSLPAFTWTADDDFRLLNNLRTKIVGSSFNPGIFLVEGDHALAMIWNAAVRIGSAYRYARRGDFRKAVYRLTGRFKAKGKIPSNWLELQYGWIPLLNDAYDGAQYIAHSVGRPLVYKVRTGRVKSQKMVYHAGNPIVTRTGYRVDETHLTCFLTEVNTVKLSGLTDPLSVLWERLPYSFVLDWFLPIQAFLNARAVANSVTGTFVKSRLTKDKIQGIDSSQVFGGYEVIDTGTTVEIGRFDRTISTSLSVPTPEIHGFGEALSWKRTANAVALLANLRHGKSNRAY